MLDGTILPGLTDAHGHLYGLGLSLDTVNLVDTQVVRRGHRARERARRHDAAPGEWILGRGWDQNDWPVKEFPTARAARRGRARSSRLPARASTVTPAVANTRRAARRGRHGRDEGSRGRARSCATRAAIRPASFIDAAMDLVERAVPAPTPEQRKARVLAAAQAIAANGLTEMHDAGIDGDDDHRRAGADRREALPDPRLRDARRQRRAAAHSGSRSGPLIDYGGRLTVRSVKLYADGALGSRGAALLAPYSDDPGNSGLMLAPPEHIEDVADARTRGRLPGQHARDRRSRRAQRDRRVRERPASPRRTASASSICRSSRRRTSRASSQRGIIASMQPTHATSDMYWAEARLGPERVKGAYAWRTILNAGGRLALGSDFPVESEPVPRHPRRGHAPGPEEAGPPAAGIPSQRLTLAEAIRGFTLDAAYAAFEESTRGTIEPGKLADLTIVDGDLFAMPPTSCTRRRCATRWWAGRSCTARGRSMRQVRRAGHRPDARDVGLAPVGSRVGIRGRQQLEAPATIEREPLPVGDAVHRESADPRQFGVVPRSGHEIDCGTLRQTGQRDPARPRDAPRDRPGPPIRRAVGGPRDGSGGVSAARSWACSDRTARARPRPSGC